MLGLNGKKAIADFNPFAFFPLRTDGPLEGKLGFHDMVRGVDLVNFIFHFNEGRAFSQIDAGPIRNGFRVPDDVGV